jgi:predicted DNA-binding protein
MKNIQKFARLSFKVSLETHAKLKALSVSQGCSMQTLMHEAIMQYIEREEKRLGII